MEASGLFTDFFRILEWRLPDCFRIFTAFWVEGFRISTGFWNGGFRIVYGFLPDFGVEASGLRTDFNRILEWRLPDCLRIFTGFWSEGFRIASGFLPDFGLKASGFLPDFGMEASGLFTNFYRILGWRLPDCLWVFTGLWGGGFRIVYGFLPDFGVKVSGLFTDFWRMLERLTVFYRIVGKKLSDYLHFFTGFWEGGFRIVSGFLPDFGEMTSGLLPNLVEKFYELCADIYRSSQEAYGFFTEFLLIYRKMLTDCIRIFTVLFNEDLNDAFRSFLWCMNFLAETECVFGI